MLRPETRSTSRCVLSVSKVTINRHVCICKDVHDSQASPPRLLHVIGPTRPAFECPVAHIATYCNMSDRGVSIGSLLDCACSGARTWRRAGKILLLRPWFSTTCDKSPNQIIQRCKAMVKRICIIYHRMVCIHDDHTRHCLLQRWTAVVQDGCPGRHVVTGTYMYTSHRHPNHP